MGDGRGRAGTGVPGKTVPGSAASGGCAGTRFKQARLGGRFPPGPAVPGGRRRGDGGTAGAGLEAGGGVVILLVTHLKPEGAEAALQDRIGAILEGREWQHIAASADPDAYCAHSSWGRSSGSSLSIAVLCPAIGSF